MTNQAGVGPQRISSKLLEYRQVWILWIHSLIRTLEGWALSGPASSNKSAQAREVAPEPRWVGEAPPNRTVQEW